MAVQNQLSLSLSLSLVRTNSGSGGDCSPNTADVFGDGERRRGNDGPRRLVRHQLQDHQTPRDDLAPAALVLAPGDPVVPVGLRVVLLRVEHGAGDVLGDVVGDVVADDKGHGLALGDVDGGDDALAQHAGPHCLFEADDGPAVVVIIAAIDADIELELGVPAVEGHRLALRTMGDASFLEDGGGVRFCGVFERREDLNLYAPGVPGGRALSAPVPPVLPSYQERALTQLQPAANALDTADQPPLELLLDAGHLAVHALLEPLGDDLGVLGAGEEVDEVHNAILVDVARLEDVGRREILLLGGAAEACGRVDAEMAPFVLVQETAEDGGRVELGPGGGLDFKPTSCGHAAVGSSPAHEVNAPIHAHEGTCPHVSNQAIVLDGKIAAAMASHLAIRALR